jgi:predicted nucleotidyltransferase
MPIQLDQNFKEFLNLLQQHGAEYLLIGGYAVNFHGYVRYTGDMDIYVSMSATNAIRVAAALNELGFDEVTPEMFTKPSSMIRIGIAPTKLEVTNFIDGVTFEECYANRLRVQIDGTGVNVMSLADLRRNKRASGRLKDLADLEKLPES